MLGFYVTEGHYCSLRLRETAINMQNLAVSKLSGAQYCNSSVSSGIETYAATLTFMWLPVTTWNNHK